MESKKAESQMTDPNPDPHMLADEKDADDWSVSLHGRMKDYATEETVETVTWEGE